MTNEADAPAAAAINPETTAAALATAVEGLVKAKAQLTDIETRLADAKGRAEQAHTAAGKVALGAAQGGANPRKSLEKHTAAKDAAEREAANLALALPDARLLVTAAEQAEKAANAAHVLAQAHVTLTTVLLPLAEAIDEKAEEFAALFVQREAVLDQLREVGALTGQQRYAHRATARTAQIVLTSAPSLAKLPDASFQKWRYHASETAFHRTMAAVDGPLYQTIMRQPSPEAEPAGPDAEPEAAHVRQDSDEAGIRYNPATGATVRQSGASPEENPLTGAKIIRR